MDVIGPFRLERSRSELTRALSRRRRLRAGFVQLVAIVGAAALGILMPQIGVALTMPSNRAVEMLIAVAAGTVTFIGVVFSLLFLVVQFGSTAFTPRLSLFRDAPIVWRAFALYTAVVVYCLTASLVIGRSEDTSVIVPAAAFIGVLVSIIVYRQLQAAAFKSIQLASTLAQIARRGREVIDSLYRQPARVTNQTGEQDRAADPHGAEDTWHGIRWTNSPAILQMIDVPRLLDSAERAGTVIKLGVGSGETLLEGTVVAVSSGKTNPEFDQQVLKAFTTGDERTFEQDPALPLGLLADIALRALSSAVNDPNTAVQAIDAIDGLLRVLATRDLDIRQVAGKDGTLRVALVLPTWSDYLAVALDDITSLPFLSPSVSRRIHRLLDDLATITTPDKRPELETYRRPILGRPRVPT